METASRCSTKCVEMAVDTVAQPSWDGEEWITRDRLLLEITLGEGRDDMLATLPRVRVRNWKRAAFLLSAEALRALVLRTIDEVEARILNSVGIDVCLEPVAGDALGVGVGCVFPRSGDDCFAHDDMYADAETQACFEMCLMLLGYCRRLAGVPEGVLPADFKMLDPESIHRFLQDEDSGMRDASAYPQRTFERLREVISSLEQVPRIVVPTWLVDDEVCITSRHSGCFVIDR